MKMRSLLAFLVYLAAAAANVVFAASQATVADAAPTKTSSSGSEVSEGSDKAGYTDKFHHGGWDRYSPNYCFRKCGFDYDYHHKEPDWDWEVRCFKRCLGRKDYDDHDWKAKRAEEVEQGVIQKREPEDHDYDRYHWCKYREHRHSSHSYHDEGDGGKKGW